MHSKDQPVYPMRVVRDLTGLTERQIRYYDSQGLVCPRRTEGGQRLYSQYEVEKLATVARLISRGLSLLEVAARLQALDQSTPRGKDEGDARVRMMRPQVRSSYAYTVGPAPAETPVSPRPRLRPGEGSTK